MSQQLDIQAARSSNLSNLKALYGYNEFRSLQGPVTDAVSMGNDSLVLMQTGGGKSLCFQIPAMTMKQHRNNKGLCLVISPLKALIRDQVHDINHTGKMTARYLIADDSDQNDRAEQNHWETLKLIADGRLDFLYLAPERLVKRDGFNRVIQTLLDNDIPVNMVVFDEAHYTLTANESFRPTYLELASLIEDFPDAVRVALTATADIHAQREIVKRTGLRKPKLFVDTDYTRNHAVNITLDNGDRNQRTEAMFSVIDPLRERCGIVYANRKKRLRELHDSYHARFPKDPIWYYDGDTRQDIRMQVEDEYHIASHGVIFATNAFGMGVNKSDIQYVCHDGSPRSISDFIQEIGRAGRDRNMASSSYAFLSYRELGSTFSTIQNPQSILEKRRYASLVNMIMSTGCRNVLLAESLGVHAETCGLCDNCTRPPRTMDRNEATHDALMILDLLDEISRKKKRITIRHMADIVRGISSERSKAEGWEFLSSFGKAAQKPFHHWENLVYHLIGRNLIEFMVSTVNRDGFESRINHLTINAQGRKALKDRDIGADTSPLRVAVEGKKEAGSRITGRRLKSSAPRFMHDMMEELLGMTSELAAESDIGEARLVNPDRLLDIVETGIFNRDNVSINPMVDYDLFETRVMEILDRYYPKNRKSPESRVVLDW